VEISSIGYLVIGLLATAAVVLALRANVRSPHKHTSARAKKPVAAGESTSSNRNPYRATAIVGCKNLCAAVSELAGKRFLVSDNNTPPLPLSNCNATKCACTYAHFDDRRSMEGDRRGPIGLHSELHKYLGQAEQRMSRGRRVADWV
jgi:hypothetical protein